MNEPEKKGLVPVLRFPQFRGAGAWGNSQLGRLGDFTGGGTPSKSNDSYWQGNIPWISSSDIYEDSIHEFNISRYISEEALNDSATKLVPEKSVLLVSRVGVGKLAITKNSVCTSQDFTNFTPVKDDLVFLGYYLRSRNKVLLEYSQGMAIKGFTKDDVSKLDVYIPSLDEQQKIADCLTSVDELITAQTQKLDALKTHKKGLMQQLFPAEGETTPKLRFSNEEDWTIASLPEVVFFQEGPGIMAVDFRSEGVPLVRLAGVCGRFVTLDGCNYLDPEKVEQKWEHFRLTLNDLIISTSATFGLSSIVTEATAGAVFYTGLIRFRPSNKRLNRSYLKTFLGSPHFARQAESAAVGGGIKHFGPTHLKKMEIPIPSLAEQQSIADCFSSLDELITAQIQKLDALKTHKKGLMQQLFPAIDDHCMDADADADAEMDGA